MNKIEKVFKQDIPRILEDERYWGEEFHVSSKHRLIAHYSNHLMNNDDTALLLAFLNQELVGYMGIYMNQIKVNSKIEKIGWLSTWWLDPKTRGTGLGSEMLKIMYEQNKGNIGISHFTDSAKRVYDKSGYFKTLKNFYGLDLILKLNLSKSIGYRLPSLKNNLSVKFIGDIFNVFSSLRLNLRKKNIYRQIGDINIEYLLEIDLETENFIKELSENDLIPKSSAFFNYLKSSRWVLNAPLLTLSSADKYKFSTYEKKFEISLIKIRRGNEIIGFIVLQDRDCTTKVLFSYFKKKNALVITKIVILHALESMSHSILCYDDLLLSFLKKEKIFIIKKESVFYSIISKTYGDIDYDNFSVHYGDGDNCFT